MLFYASSNYLVYRNASVMRIHALRQKKWREYANGQEKPIIAHIDMLAENMEDDRDFEKQVDRLLKKSIDSRN